MGTPNIIYEIKIWKEKCSTRSETIYFAKTDSIDGDTEKAIHANSEGKDISASQMTISALAFYVNQARKRISGSVDLFRYNISFPIERSIWSDKGSARRRRGLSEEEIDEFFEAYNDPNNPNPHA